MLFAILAGLLILSLFVLLWPVWRNDDLPLKDRQIFMGGVAAFFFIAGFALYFQAGAPDIVPMLAERETRIASLKASILKNSEEVKANPNNLGAWVELGKVFMESGQYDAAANAFRHAVTLSGGNPVLIMAYAGAQIAQADGKITDDAKKGLEMVLEQTPDNPEARYFMAVRMLQDGRQQEAMQSMRDLYHSLPDNSPLKGMIDKQIGRK